MIQLRASYFHTGPLPVPRIGGDALATQHVLLDLLGGGQRHCAYHPHIAWDHVSRHARFKEADQCSRIERYAGLRRQHRQYFVFTTIARHCHGSSGLHAGKRQQLGFHFKRRDVLATAADHVFHAVDKVVIVLGITAEQVAGVEPLIAPGLGGGYWIVEVTVAQRPRLVAAQNQLADFTGCYFCIMRIHQFQLHTMARLAAGPACCRVRTGPQRH